MRTTSATMPLPSASRFSLSQAGQSRKPCPELAAELASTVCVVGRVRD